MSAFLKKKIQEEIMRAEHILLLTDERIDGDTIGSTMGMFHVLKDLGKIVTVFSPRPLPEALSFLPGTEVIRRDNSVFEGEEYDLAIIFDCSDGEYIKSYLPKLRKNMPLVVFDHHATNPQYGTYNLIEPKAASTADVLWRFLRDQKIPVNKDAAHCILTGICTDTNVFSTSNTTTACLDAAHELSLLGARLQEIVRNTMMNKSVAALKLWGLAFERLHQNDEFNATATAITQQDLERLKVTTDDLEGLSNFLNAMLDGVDTVLVLYERKDGVKGGLRSHTQNVAALSEKYGGGGHIRAAGFFVPGATLEEKDGKWFVKNN